MRNRGRGYNRGGAMPEAEVSLAEAIPRLRRRDAADVLGRADRGAGRNQFGRIVVSTLSLELEDELIELLGQLDRPLSEAAREILVLELYRRGFVSSGKAGGLLGMSRADFIEYASRLGIPYLQLDDQELEREFDAVKRLQ